MVGEIGDAGYLRVENATDREVVGNILFKNGYTVSQMRQKRNGKSYEYFIRYELRGRDIVTDKIMGIP